METNIEALILEKIEQAKLLSPEWDAVCRESLENISMIERYNLSVNGGMSYLAQKAFFLLVDKGVEVRSDYVLPYDSMEDLVRISTFYRDILQYADDLMIPGGYRHDREKACAWVWLHIETIPEIDPVIRIIRANKRAALAAWEDFESNLAALGNSALNGVSRLN